MIDNTDSMTIEELRQLAESSGSVAKFADAFKMLEEMEKKTAELHQANEELRANLEKSREYRQEQDAIRALQADVSQIKRHTVEPQITKEQIFAIKDTNKRLKAIEENMELFRGNQPKQTATDKAQIAQNERIMAKYGVTADMSVKEICDRMPSGIARQYAIKKSMERNGR